MENQFSSRVHEQVLEAWLEMLSRADDWRIKLERLVDQDRRTAVRSVVEEIERERARIARELHAGAGQPLAGIKLNLELLQGSLNSLPPNAQDAVARLRNLADEALAQVRAVSHRLHPPEWQMLTIANAVRSLVTSAGLNEYFETADIDIREFSVEPGYAARVAVYRCAQESIANVIRHSGATRFSLALFPEGDKVELRVSDNGTGIRQSPASEGRGGLGLHSIRGYVAAANGVCDVTSSPHGTTIAIRLPLSED